ncbi:DUF2062 domain-containing protein [Mesonia maritima]|uniref:Glycosyltransferase involved in cell wall biosynthesis n=1 Tax=Mesonia maritima TaxID=1793873 RepID=A0ABU1K7S2_9FLAO|nr:DUF2062 domain-containing protein [Mesonia maritima]MDR6301664.1 glycosyltransferase involved in cell wall biosynthesis [Mesonia maritima]
MKLQEKFDTFKCCVLIPTYNNEKTLARVIRDVQRFTSNIIVVNDGSTDATVKILEDFKEIPQFHFQENKGKGRALKFGFQQAGRLGYDFAITIDSDGQHFAEDLSVFLNELERQNGKEILLIGSRKMDGPNVPKQNSFGNRFSSWWVYIETGVNLEDSQCGYRLYPLQVVNNMQLFTPKFEFEIEVIVKASWRKIEVKNIPVQVLYDPDERVSHFRPFIDIVRITLLNIWFVFVAFIFIIPQKRFKELKQKKRKQIWREDILKIEEPPHKKALAISLGIFIGISPFWGLQTLLVFFLAQLFKLNKVVAFLFSNVSIPPFIPFIVYASYKLGGFMLGNNSAFHFSFTNIENALASLLEMKQYLLGSFALAIIAALVIGFIFYLVFLVSDKSKKPS